jgi:hypothetical protein
MYEQAAQNGGAPFGQSWAGFGGGRSTHRTVSADELRDLFGTDDPFSDFFHTFFGGQAPGEARRPRGTPRARRGQDVEHPVELTLEEAFAGTSRRLRLSFDGAERTVDVRIPGGVMAARSAPPAKAARAMAAPRPATCSSRCACSRTRASSARARTCTRACRFR